MNVPGWGLAEGDGGGDGGLEKDMEDRGGSTPVIFVSGHMPRLRHPSYGTVRL